MKHFLTTKVTKVLQFLKKIDFSYHTKRNSYRNINAGLQGLRAVGLPRDNFVDLFE